VDIIKRLWNQLTKLDYLILFLLGILAVISLDDIVISLVRNKYYIYMQGYLFLSLSALFIALLLYIVIKYISKYIKEKESRLRSDWIEIAFFVAAIALSLYIVYWKLRQGLTGRFFLSITMADLFDQYYFFGRNIRSYFVFIYSALIHFLHLQVTPLTVMAVNKVFSVLLLLNVYFITRIITRRRLIGLIAIIIVSINPWIQFNMVSIEPRIITSYLVCSMVLFQILFYRYRDPWLFALSVLSLLLAAYTNYEVTILVGLPFVIYYCLIEMKRRETSWMLLSGIAVLLLMFLSLYVNEFAGANPLLLGDNEVAHSPSDLLSRSMFIIWNNLTVFKDLHLKSWTVTLITHISLAASVLSLCYLAYCFVRSRSPALEEHSIYLMAMILLACTFFQLAINMEGLRANWRYAATYSAIEIIIVRAVISFAVEWICTKPFVLHLVKNRIAHRLLLSITLFTILCGIIILALKLSPWVQPRYTPHYSPEAEDMLELYQGFTLNRSCYIVKVNADAENLDYLYGIYNMTFFAWQQPNTYESIARLNKSSKCYYFHKAFISDEAYKYSGAGYGFSQLH
jgi:hypothetical protein